MALISLLGILLLLLILYIWQQRKFFNLYLKIGGPFGWPFIGIAYLLNSKETFLTEMAKLEEKYGSIFVSWIGQKCFVYCADPDTLEIFLKSSSCLNKTSIYDFVNDILEGGLFTANGSIWTNHSRAMKPAFKRKPILNFYSIFKQQSNDFMKIIENFHSNMNGLTLFNEILKMTFRITYQTTLGCDPKDADENFDNMLLIFQKLTESMIDRIYQPLYHNRTFYQMTPHWKKTLKYKKALSDLLENEISKKQQKLDINSNALPSDVEENSELDLEELACIDKTFLEYILKRNEKHKFTLKDMKNEIQVLISAGFETTGVALYSTIICLATHPDIQEKLFEELINQFPTKDFDIYDADCKKLIYTEMCINEALRLAAPVPIVGRIAGDDIKLKNDVVIPKGTELVIDIFTMQRSRTIWGENAKIFNPENFRPGNYFNKHPYAFVPFTKGTRMCIGFRYAYILMKIFLATLFRNYRITTDMKYEDLIFVNSISIKYKNHPNFKIEKREK